jgi:glycosyltransferase involved in cell wall biosynthesis
MVGDGPMREELHALREALQLGGHVDFLGERKDVAALLANADIFVLSSLQEGLSLTLLEAMASGTPVITGNVSSLPEVAGSAALLVDPTDPIAISRAMTAVLTDPGLHTRLREAGLARAAQFTWEKAAGETIEVYRSVAR